MKKNMTFSAETAYIITSICLFCTGHWIGGFLCLFLAWFSNYSEKEAHSIQVPDEVETKDAQLPPIEERALPSETTSTIDEWTGHEH